MSPMRLALAVQQALETAAAKHPNITLVPDMRAIDLITGRHAANFSTSGALHGLDAYSRKSRRVETLGAGQQFSTAAARAAPIFIHRAPRSDGDGIAMAWRAGCWVSNMEFMHFIRLFDPQVTNFLITERCAARAAS